MFNAKRQAGGADNVWLWPLVVLLTCLAAWITHIVVCLKTASWGFLIAGALVMPVGIIHGIGIWFGVF